MTLEEIENLAPPNLVSVAETAYLFLVVNDLDGFVVLTNEDRSECYVASTLPKEEIINLAKRITKAA